MHHRTCVLTDPAEQAGIPISSLPGECSTCDLAEQPDDVQLPFYVVDIRLMSSTD